MLKKLYIFLLLMFFISNLGHSEYTYKASKVSIILSESDLIFVGKVTKVEGDISKYVSYIEISEILKGATNKKSISLSSKIIKGALAEDEAYPQENNIYIFFVRKGEKGYVFTTTDLGILSTIAIDIPYIPESFYYKDDIKLLLATYDKNRELFSKVGKQDLFNLYMQLKTSVVKNRVLNNFEDMVDENDTKFFAIGLQSNDVQYNLFSIRKIGNLRIGQFKETIVDLLLKTTNTDINSEKIMYLLCALRDYVDIKNKDIFLDYINSEDATYRNISYHAIGLLGDEATILALVPYYGKETESSHRLAILSALENIKNNDVLIPVLLELKKIEPIEYMVQHIDWIIAKRIGG